MQHDKFVVGDDLVEQMGRPQHADALLSGQTPDMAEDVGACLDVEADCRLVEQQQARPMQQRASDLDAAASVRPKDRAPCSLARSASPIRDSTSPASGAASRRPMPCSAAW